MGKGHTIKNLMKPYLGRVEIVGEKYSGEGILAKNGKGNSYTLKVWNREFFEDEKCISRKHIICAPGLTLEDTYLRLTIDRKKLYKDETLEGVLKYSTGGKIIIDTVQLNPIKKKN